MKEKVFKCGYLHCSHENKDVKQSDTIQIKNRHWHKDCYEIDENIKEVAEIYYNHISSTVVMGFLKKVINEIVFKRLLNDKVAKNDSDLEASRYLLFAMNYALEKNIRLNSPAGLYYLIDNAKVKEAWARKKAKEIEKEASRELEEDDFDFDAVRTEYKPKTPTKQSGFGSIFG